MGYRDSVPGGRPSSCRCTRLHNTADVTESQSGDTRLVSEDTQMTARSRLRQAVAFARSAEPRPVVSGHAIRIDIVLAVLVAVASLVVMRFSYPRSAPGLTINPVTGLVTQFGASGGLLAGIPWQALVAAVVTSVPLAARRRFPLAAFLVLLLGALATRRYATDITFLTVVFAAYSAVVHSRFRNAALVSVPTAGVVVAAAFWTAVPAPVNGPASAVPTAPTVPAVPPGPSGRLLPGPGGHVSRFATAAGTWRLPALLVLVSLVSIVVVSNVVHAGERIRRLQAEHEAATRRAVELERTRIASELHDVVTHNVSVMIVQAGAARQVLADAPDKARSALLAVESSGRAAMAELRHLLGLLSPSGAPADAAGTDANDLRAGQELRPQPGLGQLQALIDRVAATGVPVELQVCDVPQGLSAGLDLAVFRVVQEALTNVIKHAGKPRTSVKIDHRHGDLGDNLRGDPAGDRSFLGDDLGGDLIVEVANAGPPIPAALPAAVRGDGRGLLGLRERVALYGGQLEAGPRPGGGWLVRARIPLSPPAAGLPDLEPTGSSVLVPVAAEPW